MNGLKKCLRSVPIIFGSDFSIWRTIYFNFHYFPYTIAKRFPVYLYRSVRFKKMKGRILIDTLPIKSGMIHIGKETYGFQRKQDYTIWEQEGGTVMLEDGVDIGKGTFVCIGQEGVLKIEQNTSFGGNNRVICMKSVTIKSNTKVAWDVQILDTDFRATINTITKTKNCIEKAIVIGRNNWLCFDCTILKGSITPDNCIVQAKALINKDFSNAGENIVIGLENNIKVLAKYISWEK